jgi:flagellar biosynthetic protein FliO
MSLSTLGMFIRLIFSLSIVIGLMWVAARMLRRRGLAPLGAKRAGTGVQVELLARRPLGRNSSIAVVRIGERAIVVGISDHQITKLDDADINDIDLNDAPTIWTGAQGPNGPASAWKTMLDQMRNRTTRR